MSDEAKQLYEAAERGDKARVKELQQMRWEDGRLPFPVAEEEGGGATLHGYYAMSLCEDEESWLGLGEKMGGYRAGEAALEQIEKDIPRTEAATITPEEAGALRRILRTFARRYPAVGYCQGMNNIALAVLRTVGGGAAFEQQSFWSFAGLCDRVCRGYYSESMTGVQVDAKVIEDLTREQTQQASPKLSVIDHLESLGYPIGIKLTQWLINLFLGAMPMPLLLALWDWLCVDGTAALICFATALITHLREELLLCTDFQQAADTLQSDNVPHSTNAYLLRPTFPLDPCHLS